MIDTNRLLTRDPSDTSDTSDPSDTRDDTDVKVNTFAIVRGNWNCLVPFAHWVSDECEQTGRRETETLVKYAVTKSR
jgi:hypothetical protein